jgi:taurine dioxygenase
VIETVRSDQVVPLSGGLVSGGLGARLPHDLTRALSDGDRSEIEGAFHQYGVLIFEGAMMGFPMLAAFVNALGEPDDGKGRLASTTQYAGIRVVENVERGAFGPRGNSELNWHADRFFNPVLAGILNSVVVSPEGGDTSFADMRRAYDDLPNDLLAAINGCSIKQDCVFDADGAPAIRPGGMQIEDIVRSPGIALPIVQMHRQTGRPYLYLGNRLNAHILGLSLEQSDALLDRLYVHIDQPHLHYRHQWRADELILYDNVRCMHRRDAFPADAERKLYASVVAKSDLL